MMLRYKEAAQALIEYALFVLCFLILVACSFYVAKLIILKHDSMVFTRETAFKDTYLNADVEGGPGKPDNYEFDAVHSARKRRTSLPGSSLIVSFLNSLPGILKISRYDTRTELDLEDDILKFIGKAPSHIDMHHSIFIQDDSFYESSKLKFALWAIAASAVLGNGKGIMDGADKLFKESGEFRKEQELYEKLPSWTE